MGWQNQIVGKWWSTYLILLSLLLSLSCDTIPPEATVRIQSYRYFQFLPDDYEVEDEWPLILFLHGAGQHASDSLDVVSYEAVPKYAAGREAFPFVVIAPQSPPPDTWISEQLIDLLDEITSKFKIDPDRIYVTGLSMGGFGSFLLATDYPDRIAAIAPMAGGGMPEKACQMKDVPAWVFHNSGDRIVDVSQSENMVNALRACGSDVIFTRYERNGHDAWSDTYNNSELYTWFLEHRLSDRQ